MRTIIAIALFCAVAAAEDGKVFVRSDPGGAGIAVVSPDGAKRDLGKKTPAMVILPVGKYDLELALAGHKPGLLSVDLDGKAIAKPDAVKLAPITVAVDVIFEGEGWAVFVDGARAKDEKGKPQMAPCTVEMTLGKHALTLAKDGFLDIAQKVEVKEKITVEIKAKESKGASMAMTHSATVPQRLSVADRWSTLVGTWLYDDGDFVLEATGGTFTLAQHGGSHSNGCFAADDKLIFPWSSGGVMVVMFVSTKSGSARCWYKVPPSSEPLSEASVFPMRADWSKSLSRK